MFVQAAGADRASDVIPLEWYKAELYRLMDMAEGDIPTRVLLATDDPTAEAEVRGAFVDGGSLAVALRCEGDEVDVEDCSWTQLLAACCVFCCQTAPMATAYERVMWHAREMGAAQLLVLYCRAAVRCVGQPQLCSGWQDTCPEALDSSGPWVLHKGCTCTWGWRVLLQAATLTAQPSPQSSRSPCEGLHVLLMRPWSGPTTAAPALATAAAGIVVSYPKKLVRPGDS